MFKNLCFHVEMTLSKLTPTVFSNLDNGWYLLEIQGPIPLICPKESILQVTNTVGIGSRRLVYLPGYLIVQQLEDVFTKIILYKLNNINNKGE